MGNVYALGAWGHLVCIEGKSGEVIWERELLRELGLHWRDDYRILRYGRSNSPLVYNGMVIDFNAEQIQLYIKITVHLSLTAIPAYPH